MKKEKKITKKQLKKQWKKAFDKAWKLFSLYVRNRDNGVCIACNYKDEPKNMNAGHFIHGKLDLDELNINCSCIRCNKWLHGNLGMYAIALIKKYGIEKVEELIKRAEEHKGYSIEELEEIINKYGGKNV